jgi:hypothetical protein
MDKKTGRTIRRDLTILTSILLLGLVGVSALTGVGMDEAEGVLPVDDAHALVGYALALVAGLHALMHLGVMRTYVTKRVRELTGEAARTREP